MGKEHSPEQDALNAAWHPKVETAPQALGPSSVATEIDFGPEDPNAEPLVLADDEERIFLEGHKTKGPAEPIRIIPKLNRAAPSRDHHLDRRPPVKKVG